MFNKNLPETLFMSTNEDCFCRLIFNFEFVSAAIYLCIQVIFEWQIIDSYQSTRFNFTKLFQIWKIIIAKIWKLTWLNSLFPPNTSVSPWKTVEHAKYASVPSPRLKSIPFIWFSKNMLCHTGFDVVTPLWHSRKINKA